MDHEHLDFDDDPSRIAVKCKVHLISVNSSRTCGKVHLQYIHCKYIQRMHFSVFRSGMCGIFRFSFRAFLSVASSASLEILLSRIHVYDTWQKASFCWMEIRIDLWEYHWMRTWNETSFPRNGIVQSWGGWDVICSRKRGRNGRKRETERSWEVAALIAFDSIAFRVDGEERWAVNWHMPLFLTVSFSRGSGTRKYQGTGLSVCLAIAVFKWKLVQ